MIRYGITVRFLGILILLLVCNVCRREEKTVFSNRIVIGQITSAVSLDPHLDSEEATYSTLSHFYDRLVTFDSEMDLKPDLAVRWENLSDTVWRFHLRDGVVFHDGRPFQAEDVVASIGRAQKLRSYYVESIKHVYAVDHQTVEVETNGPAPVLLDRLAMLCIVPRSTGLAPIVHPLGTGPYRFVSGVPNGSIEGERFFRFWGPPPAFDRVTIVPLPDPKERSEAVSSGKVDLVNNFPLEYYQWALKQQNIRIVSREGLGVVLLGFSMAKGSPFADIRVREAVSLALDRGKIIGNDPQPLAAPMHQIVPPGIFGYSTGLGPFSPDRKLSNELMIKAGYSQGVQAELLLPNSLEELGKQIREQLEAANIHLRLKVLPWKDFYARFSESKHELTLFAWSASTGDASDVLDGLHTPRDGYGSANYFSYSNPRLDELIELSLRTPKVTERRKLLTEAMAIVRMDLPVLPIVQRFNIYAARPDLDWTPRLDRQVRAFDIRPGHK